MAVDNDHYMRDIGLLAWLAKDLGWVLLIAPIAWPAALVAIIVESHVAVSEWSTASAGDRVHTLAELCWLIGNCVWMSGELLFDKKSPSIVPWYSGAILAPDEKAYNAWAHVCLVILCFGFFNLLTYYILCVGDHLSGNSERRKSLLAGNPQDDASLQPRQETLVFGYIPEAIYTRMFLFPWIAKDVCWNLEWTGLLLFFGGATVAIALDYVRRYGGPHFWAELFWFCGNAVWAISELLEKGPATGMRLAAAVLLAIGLCCVATPHTCPSLARHWVAKGPGLSAGEASREREPLMPAAGS